MPGGAMGRAPKAVGGLPAEKASPFPQDPGGYLETSLYIDLKP